MIHYDGTVVRDRQFASTAQATLAQPLPKLANEPLQERERPVRQRCRGSTALRR